MESRTETLKAARSAGFLTFPYGGGQGEHPEELSA